MARLVLDPPSNPLASKATRMLIPVLLIAIVLAVVGWRCVKVIPAGHVGVATLFGKVKQTPYESGLHFVNPLLAWELFDIRQDSHKETATVPTRDQQNTDLDISIQFRLISSMAPQMLAESGNRERAIEVHLVPNVRSVVREQGKTIARAEDFFNEQTQQRLQLDIKTLLEDNLRPKGIEVQDVLIRDIRLPEVILRQVEQKKVKEQEAEREKAELERRKIEAQQQVVQATAQREAAEQEAQRRKLIADAQAYEIEKINQAVAQNPAYIQLQAIEALKSISKDPAAKMYFMNGESAMPLPLMNIGEPLR